MQHLFSLLPDEIAATLRAAGVPVRDDEARRILAHTLSPTAAKGVQYHRSRSPISVPGPTSMSA